MEQTPQAQKPYVVIYAFDHGGLEKQAEKLYAAGYNATGGVSVGDRDGRLYQAFVLNAAPSEPGVTRLREPRRSKNGQSRAT